VTGIYGDKTWIDPFLDENPESPVVPQAVTLQEMSRITALASPGPVLAVVQIPRRDVSEISIQDNLTLVLDGIQDPGNLGTIIRVADWFRIRQVVCSEDCVDVFNPKVVQATMGSIVRVPVYYARLDSFLDRYPEEWVYGMYLEGEDLYRAPLTPGGIIVIGSEARGISAPLESRIRRKITIPPGGRTASTGSHAESLNAAVAAALVCSEFNRRRYA
jgi:TrmH family RNA methyltransferase